MHELLTLDATELARRIARKETSAEEATQAVLAHIQATDAKVGAYLHVAEDSALMKAREIDKQNPGGPLAGVPVAVKDNIHVEGMRTTCASRMLEGYQAQWDATAVRRLKDAGAVIVGKTNLDEFAMGSSCENSALGTTRNPWDLERVPGGSSGGSGACVAARSAYLSLGSDTGGSVRFPGSFCGVVGYKPSYGRVSRYGLVSFASSLDQIGPFGRSVRDVAACMGVMSGADPADSTALPREVPDFAAALRDDLRGVKVGVVQSYFDELPNREVADACRKALERMKELGAELVDVTLPSAEYGVAVYYVITSAEASSNLARFDGVRYGSRIEADSGIQSYFDTRGGGFGREVQRRIMLGTYALSAAHYEEYFGRAARVRTLIRNDFDRAFADCDVITGPCAPFTAFTAGEKSDPLSMYLCDIFTIPASLAGLCALSLPVGFDGGGLPIGLHIQAPAFQDDRLLGISHALEQAMKEETDRMPPAVASASRG
jgi:aspartyl-tRNA(Asn)/glutamyl-tRNA(Gln) amidotransferase subunit A